MSIKAARVGLNSLNIFISTDNVFQTSFRNVFLHFCQKVVRASVSLKQGRVFIPLLCAGGILPSDCRAHSALNSSFSYLSLISTTLHPALFLRLFVVCHSSPFFGHWSASQPALPSSSRWGEENNPSHIQSPADILFRYSLLVDCAPSSFPYRYSVVKDTRGVIPYRPTRDRYTLYSHGRLVSAHIEKRRFRKKRGELKLNFPES